MARTAVLILLTLVAGLAVGYLAAGRRAGRELDRVLFVNAVEGASLAANSLMLLDRGDAELLAGLYRSQMRSELERAGELTLRVDRVDFPIPNLVEGVVRAEAWCRSDPELGEIASIARTVHDHLAALHATALEEHADGR